LGPPTTITTPPRDFGPNGAPTTYFWDPDIIAVDPSFNDVAQPNTSIKRLYTGLLWAEGPAWSAQGRYLVWSDIPNNRQMRWSEDDGRVSVFRMPSNNSNGNSFDFQGRQLSCEHLARRALRARRHIVRARGQLWRQEAQLAERRRCPPGRQLLVHRPALWRPAL
jgi:gluconolactonase